MAIGIVIVGFDNPGRTHRMWWTCRWRERQAEQLSARTRNVRSDRPSETVPVEKRTQVDMSSHQRKSACGADVMQVVTFARYRYWLRSTLAYWFQAGQLLSHVHIFRRCSLFRRTSSTTIGAQVANSAARAMTLSRDHAIVE
jgi:hypothetical protein